jgi:hypothetical protein
VVHSHQITTTIIEDLSANETKVIGQASVPKLLESAHNGLCELLKKEEQRRLKTQNSEYNCDGALFYNPLAKGRLRLLKGAFQALAKHKLGTSRYRDQHCR